MSQKNAERQRAMEKCPIEALADVPHGARSSYDRTAKVEAKGDPGTEVGVKTFRDKSGRRPNNWDRLA